MSTETYRLSNPGKLGSNRHYFLHASMHKWDNYWYTVSIQDQPIKILADLLVLEYIKEKYKVD